MIMFNIEAQNVAFDTHFNFALSRFLETAVESIPQVILQALALAGVVDDQRATGQYISLAWSILTIAYTFVSATFMLDTSEHFRAVEPRWYGFIEHSRESAMQLALTFFILGYCCSKLLAIAILGNLLDVLVPQAAGVSSPGGTPMASNVSHRTC